MMGTHQFIVMLHERREKARELFQEVGLAFADLAALLEDRAMQRCTPSASSPDERTTPTPGTPGGSGEPTPPTPTRSEGQSDKTASRLARPLQPLVKGPRIPQPFQLAQPMNWDYTGRLIAFEAIPDVQRLEFVRWYRAEAIPELEYMGKPAAGYMDYLRWYIKHFQSGVILQKENNVWTHPSFEYYYDELGHPIVFLKFLPDVQRERVEQGLQNLIEYTRDGDAFVNYLVYRHWFEKTFIYNEAPKQPPGIRSSKGELIQLPLSFKPGHLLLPAYKYGLGPNGNLIIYLSSIYRVQRDKLEEEERDSIHLDKDGNAYIDYITYCYWWQRAFQEGLFDRKGGPDE